MPELFFRKTLGGLKPVDEDGEDFLRSLPEGKIVKVKTWVTRNEKHHRLFFGLLKIVVENSDIWQTTDQLLDALKIATGHVEPVIMGSGKVHYKLKSISFSSMDQQEFRAFYTRCVRIICDRWLPGVKDEDLRSEVEKMVT